MGASVELSDDILLYAKLAGSRPLPARQPAFPSKPVLHLYGDRQIWFINRKFDLVKIRRG